MSARIIPPEALLALVLARALRALVCAQEHEEWDAVAEARRCLHTALELCDGLEEKRRWDEHLCGLDPAAWHAYMREVAGE